MAGCIANNEHGAALHFDGIKGVAAGCIGWHAPTMNFPSGQLRKDIGECCRLNASGNVKVMLQFDKFKPVSQEQGSPHGNGRLGRERSSDTFALGAKGALSPIEYLRHAN
jgi:hypothetical protein